MKYVYTLLIAASAALVSPMTLAHDQSVATGFVAGLLHPVTGIDHLVALMLAGFFIGRLISARSHWIAVSGLLIALGSGTVGALLLGAQAWMEAAILLSLPLFLAVQWIEHRGMANFALITIGLLMIAHGWVHGVELAGMNNSFIFGLLLMSAAVMCLFSLVGSTVRSGAAAVSHARR